MFSCRVAWQRCRLLAQKTAYGVARDVLQRQPMSTHPPRPGEMLYAYVFCGAVFVIGMAYAYKGVCDDQARYNERVAQKHFDHVWVPRPWPPQSEQEKEGEQEEAAVQAASGEGEDEEEKAAAETAVEAGAEVGAEAALEVEMTGDGAVEAAEDSVQSVAEPAAEPESNGMASPEEEAGASEA